MKSYLIFVIALMIGSVFFEFHLIEYYKPPVEALTSTTVSTGKFYFVSQRHVAGLIPTINQIPLDCYVYFGGSARACPVDVKKIRAGTEVNVAIARVSTLFGVLSLPMSIKVQGEQVYSVTPEQVILDYARLSRRYLAIMPIFILGIMIVSPLTIDRFRSSLLALFGF